MSQCHGCLKDNIKSFCSACEKLLFNRSKVSYKLTFNWNDISHRMDEEPMAFSVSGNERKAFISKPRGVKLFPKTDILDKSEYIIKPILSGLNLYDQSPANEHVTMQIAKQLFRIKTAECAYMNFADGTPAFVVKRFDFDSNEEKLNQENFESILEVTDKTIFKSYQDVGELLCPLNKVDLLRILIFNFIIGNGDFQLSDISLLETTDGDMVLSPSYDLMNTKIHLNDNLLALNLFKEQEQTTLSDGKKYMYSSTDFVELGKRLKIKVRIILKMIDTIKKKEKDLILMVDKSFLSDSAKDSYKNNIIKNYMLFYAK